MSGPDIPCIITTMDNLHILKVQVDILRDDPLITRIIVVNQESRDGTRQWLDKQVGLTAIHRINNGAGPGRNAGLDAAGKFDYVFMLDGGMRPLRPGVGPMVDYLEKHVDVDVLGLEVNDLETDIDRAWRRWPWDEIPDDRTYQHRQLSLTAYCLCRWRAWDGFRFEESGPWGEPGWGADDDEMAHQWAEGGVVLHAITGIAAYRRGSGSFRRLFQETGIWPNQYGSTYEKRVVWLRQNWPQYDWGVPPPDRVITIQADGVEKTAKRIKAFHNIMREDKFEPPWAHVWKPYRIIVQCNADDTEFLEWAEPRRLRQHHGDTIIVGGEIVKRNADNEETWTGDFVVEVTDGEADT